jgi:DNA (cytosine-5)-methyltransferase 1
VLLIENVPEFEQWGPLDERNQPIKERKGEDFRAFVGNLRELGYQVEWRVLCAADYGDPTTRRRFFLQAARDGRPIVWPAPTHRDSRKPATPNNRHLPAWRSAAECIDWSLPCPSIFSRKKPLAEATLRRIATGVVRFVLQGKPFLVNTAYGGTTGRGRYVYDTHEPIRTLTTSSGHALVAPSLIQTSYGERKGQAPRVLDLHQPLGTVVAGGQKHGLVAAFLAKHYGGPGAIEKQPPGLDPRSPMGTVTAQDKHGLAAVHLLQMRGTSPEHIAASAHDAGAPLGTVTSGGNHHALVAAFIQHYYSSGGNSQTPGLPLHTITTIAKHGLVTVEIDGESYAISDIGLRMLEPHELARAMGFPSWFRWNRADGRPLTKRDAVKMIGNACPVGTVKELIKAVVLQRRDAFGMEAA